MISFLKIRQGKNTPLEKGRKKKRVAFVPSIHIPSFLDDNERRGKEKADSNKSSVNLIVDVTY